MFDGHSDYFSDADDPPDPQPGPAWDAQKEPAQWRPDAAIAVFIGGMALYAAVFGWCVYLMIAGR